MTPGCAWCSGALLARRAPRAGGRAIALRPPRGVLSGIYVMLTLSLNLITGFCGQFSLGHAGFYGIGAYTAALLAVSWGSPFLLNLLAAAVVAGAAGFLIGLPTLRLGGIYLAMATLGFGEIIHLVLLNWLGLTRGPLGIPAIPRPDILGIDLATPARQYYLALALVVLSTWSSRGWWTPASARRSRPSARTRSRPRRWACPRPGSR